MKTHNYPSKRPFYSLVFFLSILASIISSCRTTRINLELELRSLQQADKNWAEACAAKNVDRMLDFYDIDAYNIDPQGNIHRSEDELRKLWTNEFNKSDYSLIWQLNEAYVAQSGDISYTIGSWEMKFTSKDGKQMIYRGTYIAIWKKQVDGTWKVLVDKS
jgi:ketosteroid isomerase-like protein